MTTRIDIQHYTYRVTWSPEDKEHLATCLELPSVSWLAESPTEALAGITRVVDEITEDMEKNGEEIPTPFSDRSFSGRFNVRIPPDLHRALVTAAAEEGLSLNRFISDRLAHS